MTQWQTGGWMPDMPAYKNPGLTVAKGCYNTPDGFDAPLVGTTTQGTTVTSSQVIGAISVLDKSGTGYNFAATDKDLWLYNAGTTSWTNKTRTGAGNYTGGGARWNFAQFGEDVLAVNGVDELQFGTLPVGGLFANRSAGAAPIARVICSLEPGFVMLGYVAGGTLPAGTLGNGVQWCAINDSSNWPTLGTAAAAAVQSDYNILPEGGNVQAIIASVGTANGAVLMDRAVFRLDYVGAPTIFAFRLVDSSRGCICKNAVAQVGGLAYFVAADGFMAFDGVACTPIGRGKVDSFFFGEVDLTKLDRVNASVDQSRKIIVFAYPRSGATGGNPNRWLIYSYATSNWRYCDDPAIVMELLVPNFRSPGYTLDTLDTPLPGGPDGAASVGFSVDNPAYVGGTPVFAGFSPSHVLNYFNGANLAAQFETGETDGSDPAAAARPSRMWVSEMRATTDSALATCSIGYRDTLSAIVNYTTPSLQEVDRLVAIRRDAQFVRGRVNIPAADTWTYFSGMDIVARNSGRR